MKKKITIDLVTTLESAKQFGDARRVHHRNVLYSIVRCVLIWISPFLNLIQFADISPLLQSLQQIAVEMNTVCVRLVHRKVLHIQETRFRVE